MNCPHCSSTRGIEIDMHSDGYAQDILECTICGTLWLEKSREIISASKKAA